MKSKLSVQQDTIDEAGMGLSATSMSPVAAIQNAPLPFREIRESDNPGAFLSTHWLHYVTGDRKTILEMSGIVKTEVQCGSTEWQRQRLWIVVKIRDFPSPDFVVSDGVAVGLHVEHFTVFVTPAAIAQDWAPESLGWAVDGFGAPDMYSGPLISGGSIVFYADIALRGRMRTHLLRIAYGLKVTGVFVVQPGPN